MRKIYGGTFMVQQHGNVKHFFSSEAAFCLCGSKGRDLPQLDPGLRIRQAKPQESGRLAARKRGICPLYSTHGQIAFSHADNYEQHTKAGNAQVLELNDKIAGYIKMIDKPDKSLLIYNIAVDPQWQGNGYGSILINFGGNYAMILNGSGYIPMR